MRQRATGPGSGVARAAARFADRSHGRNDVEAGIAAGDKKVGLANVDLNFLKQVNDEFGHDKGDEALEELCRLVCVVFAHSPVFRIGGDDLFRRADRVMYARKEQMHATR